MREEDDSNWFARWEEQLPTLEELMPMSQTLITPNLAVAFDIRNPNALQIPSSPPPLPHLPPHSLAHSALSSRSNSADFDSTRDDSARTLKRPRLVWTPQLHKRFVEAVGQLGIRNAVPKTIMQMMSVDGLTRENVASHLQKYRLHLKRVQGISGASVGGGNGVAGDPAIDHLFATSRVPQHFLHSGQANSVHYSPFVSMPTMQHHHYRQKLQLQPQYHCQRQAEDIGLLPPNRRFEHPFRTRQSQTVHRIGAPLHSSVRGSYIENLELATVTAGRKALTLFPAGDD